ncbi:hypothetical protein ABZ826_34410 [Streptomyces sp. NPDC047515]|uniref:hypothetical protein n=1 Tax=Streptomyces sp. NPDC047515 TaxID=3155380 RepID=UPI0033CB15BC
MDERAEGIPAGAPGEDESATRPTARPHLTPPRTRLAHQPPMPPPEPTPRAVTAARE